MKILALDTALDACSVAVTDGDVVCAYHHAERSRGHAETLLPLIRSMMRQAHAEFSDLNMIAVSVGPGTFTGLRIGLATARGLSLASGKPCIGITTLEALAAAVRPEPGEDRPLVVTADARRREVYLQIFSQNPGGIPPRALSEAHAVPIEQASRSLPESDFVLTGGGAGLLDRAGVLKGLNVTILERDPNPDARVIAQIAAWRGLPDPGAPPPAPVYLRAPDAKLPGGRDPGILP